MGVKILFAKANIRIPIKGKVEKRVKGEGKERAWRGKTRRGEREVV